MRCKPRTLQCRHQCLRMYLRLQQIHTDKHNRQYRREGKYPLILPSRIHDDTCQRQEERIPQSRLTHRAQRWTLKRYPHQHYKTEEHHQSHTSGTIGQLSVTLPSSPSTYSPKQHGCNRKKYKLIPSHHILTFSPSHFLTFSPSRLPKTNIHTAPPSIINMPAYTNGNQGSLTSSSIEILLSAPMLVS